MQVYLQPTGWCVSSFCVKYLCTYVCGASREVYGVCVRSATRQSLLDRGVAPRAAMADIDTCVSYACACIRRVCWCHQITTYIHILKNTYRYITARTRVCVWLAPSLPALLTLDSNLAFTRYCFTSRLYCTIIYFANTPFIVQYIAQYYQLLHPPAQFSEVFLRCLEVFGDVSFCC